MYIIGRETINNKTSKNIYNDLLIMAGGKNVIHPLFCVLVFLSHVIMDLTHFPMF